MTGQVQLIGQVVVILLVYAFVWRVLRTAWRDLRTAPQADDSTVISPAEANAARVAAGMPTAGAASPGQGGRLVVISSDVLSEGQPVHIDEALTIGRAPDNDIALDDSVVSTRHARLRPPGIVTDLDSTNGTFVNGDRIAGTRDLTAGDQVRIGSTTFRFEGPS